MPDNNSTDAPLPFGAWLSRARRAEAARLARYAPSIEPRALAMPAPADRASPAPTVVEDRP